MRSIHDGTSYAMHQPESPMRSIPDGISCAMLKISFLPARFDGTGGGLTLSPRGDNQCPLYIGQDSMGKPGIPVILSHWLSTVDYIYETEDLTIKMDVNATTCAQPTYWSVSAPGTFIEPVFMAAGLKPSNGSFQIKKTEGGIGSYKIMFCPTTGEDCVDVGIFVDRADGVRRLALSFAPFLRPFEFVFVKATGTETSSKTLSII
ncbi:hypothetical protein Bca101_027683 [Brassica carinata]